MGRPIGERTCPKLNAAQQALAADHLAVAFWVARKWWDSRRHVMPLEDWRGHALVGLTKAATRYDPERGVKFSTFAHRVIENEFSRLLIARLVYWRRAELRTRPFADSRERQQDDGSPDPADRECDPGDRASQREEVALVRRLLPPRWFRLLEMIAAGCDYKEIGLELGCKRQRIEQLRQKIRERVRADRKRRAALGKGNA